MHRSTLLPCILHSDKLSICAVLSHDRGLEYGQIFQQRDDADHDDHDLQDLPNAAFDGQALNQPRG